ncbi:MAG: GNAT family N-acetyltransferase [Flavobacteriaceae bacterium]|nr:MAG: GNAT family N-acetyltransferase [Flavobacteriaceae bacterium]
MNTLKGTHINLRAIEPTDLDFLYQIENDESFWEVSNTQKPFSKYLLQQYLENAQQDIYEAKQLRLVIEDKNESPVGLIDLFDFDPKHKRAGIGIVISQQFQDKGFASESLELLINFAFTYLDLHQLFANITEDNMKSILLFEKLGFKKSGVKKDWIYTNGNFKNELIYQLIHD